MKTRAVDKYRYEHQQMKKSCPKQIWYFYRVSAYSARHKWSCNTSVMSRRCGESVITLEPLMVDINYIIE